MMMENIETYAFPLPENEDLHLSVKRMEEIYDEHEGELDLPHRHAYYTIVWVMAGKGEHLIDFNTYSLQKHAIFFVSPGQIHQVKHANRPRGWVITFSKSFLQMNHVSESFLTEMNLFNGFEERPPLLLPKAVGRKLDLLMQDMQQMFHSDYHHKLAGLGAYLKLFLVYCEEECTLEGQAEPKASPGRLLLREFKQRVEADFRTSHSVSHYADALSVTAKHLNQVTKALVGQTAKEIIMEKVILNAKRELKYSDLSIKEIAYELGFEEPLYFSAVFKKAVGRSPSSFRKS